MTGILWGLVAGLVAGVPAGALGYHLRVTTFARPLCFVHECTGPHTHPRGSW